MVEDGYGSHWTKCGRHCGLHVVRPGKAQCTYEGGYGCRLEHRRSWPFRRVYWRAYFRWLE